MRIASASAKAIVAPWSLTLITPASPHKHDAAMQPQCLLNAYMTSVHHKVLMPSPNQAILPQSAYTTTLKALSATLPRPKKGVLLPDPSTQTGCRPS